MPKQHELHGKELRTSTHTYSTYLKHDMQVARLHPPSRSHAIKGGASKMGSTLVRELKAKGTSKNLLEDSIPPSRLKQPMLIPR